MEHKVILHNTDNKESIRHKESFLTKAPQCKKANCVSSISLFTIQGRRFSTFKVLNFYVFHLTVEIKALLKMIERLGNVVERTIK